MSIEVLLKGIFIPKDYESREKMNEILKTENILEFTYSYIDDKFEINEILEVGEKIDYGSYLQNLKDKLSQYRKKGNNFLGIYHLKNKIDF